MKSQKMTNLVGKVRRDFLEFLRSVFYCACYIFVVIQVLAILFSAMNGPEFAMTLTFVAVGYRGCLFFQSSNRVNFKTLNIITLCSLLFWFFLMATLWSRETETETNFRLQTLMEKAKFYDWKRDGKADERSLNATKDLDSLQDFSCCGFHDAYNWDEFRPDDIDEEYYPPSCCRPGTVDKVSGLCPYSVVEEGCLGRFEEMIELVRSRSSVFCVASVVLTLSAHVYAHLIGL